jgi:hypothetical protein
MVGALFPEAFVPPEASRSEPPGSGSDRQPPSAAVNSSASRGRNDVVADVTVKFADVTVKFLAAA